MRNTDVFGITILNHLHDSIEKVINLLENIHVCNMNITLDRLNIDVWNLTHRYPNIILPLL